jgi:hypothetical protein
MLLLSGDTQGHGQESQQSLRQGLGSTLIFKKIIAAIMHVHHAVFVVTLIGL